MTVSISLVVPVYAGEAYLRDLAAQVDALRNWAQEEQAPFTIGELIFVDDAAIDGSGDLIDALAAENPQVIALHLSRNFGQHPATIAGVLHSSGDWVVTLDEDLQHKPERILELLKQAVTTRCDLVYAQAKGGVHDTMMRDFSSKAFKWAMQRLTNNPNLQDFNSFRLIRGAIARASASVCSHDTYYDIGLSWFTQRIGTVRMELKDERYISSGKSGYKFSTLLAHAWRMVFSSQIKLLRVGAAIGLAVVLISLLSSIYFVGLRVFFPEAIGVRGWASLFLAISFFGGFLALMLGIALQYLSTLVLKAHGKPTFFIVDRASDTAIARWFDAREPSKEPIPEPIKEP